MKHFHICCDEVWASKLFYRPWMTTGLVVLGKSAPTSDLYEERVFLVTLIQTGCHSDLNLCETLPYQMWFRSAPPAALSAAIPLRPPGSAPQTQEIVRNFLSKVVTYFVIRWRRKVYHIFVSQWVVVQRTSSTTWFLCLWRLLPFPFNCGTFCMCWTYHRTKPYQWATPVCVSLSASYIRPNFNNLSTLFIIWSFHCWAIHKNISSTIFL